MMNRLAGVVFTAVMCALQGTAMAGTLNPDQAIRSLVAHGIIARFPADISAGHPFSGSEVAELAAQAGMSAVPSELGSLGVRQSAVEPGHLAIDSTQLKRFMTQTALMGPMRASLAGLAFGSAPATLLAANSASASSVRLPFVIQRRPGLLAFGSAAGITYGHLFSAPSEAAGEAMVADAVFGIAHDASLPVRADAPVPATSSPGAFAPWKPEFGPAVGFASSFPNPGLAGVSFRVHPISAPTFEPALRSDAYPLVAMRTPLKDAASFGASPLTVVVPASSFAYTPLSSNDAEFSATNLSPSQGLKAGLSLPIRVGAFKGQGTLAALHLQELAPVTPFATSVRATEDQVTAGTTFDVHALGRPVSVGVSASYDRLLRNDRTAFLTSNQAPAATSLSNEGLTVPNVQAGTSFNPNYLDVTRRSLGAAAAVSLTNDLSLNLQYKTQYYTGSYSTLGQNVDGRKDSYLGNLTYTIPRTSSAIVFSAKQYRYHDIFVPSNSQTLNRADLNFTVKF